MILEQKEAQTVNMAIVLCCKIMNFATEPCHDEQHVVEQVLVGGAIEPTEGIDHCLLSGCVGHCPSSPAPGKRGGPQGITSTRRGVRMQHE